MFATCNLQAAASLHEGCAHRADVPCLPSGLPRRGFEEGRERKGQDGDAAMRKAGSGTCERACMIRPVCLPCSCCSGEEGARGKRYVLHPGRHQKKRESVPGQKQM